MLFQSDAIDSFFAWNCFGLIDWKSMWRMKPTKTRAQDLVVLECQRWASKGINIKYEIRDNRKGYKAGALKEGMKHSYVKDCDYVAIFDADFQPEPDFLFRTIPFLVHNPELALVQARWKFGMALSLSVAFPPPTTRPTMTPLSSVFFFLKFMFSLLINFMTQIESNFSSTHLHPSKFFCLIPAS